MSKKGILIGAGIAAGGIALGATISHGITKNLVEIAITRIHEKAVC